MLNSATANLSVDNRQKITGYLHPLYAASLAEFGTPCLLPRSGGYILKRPIPDSTRYDAMGCYPIFTCQDWTALTADLNDLARQADPPVSLTLVTDPFGRFDPAALQGCFPDACFPYKQHYVTDLAGSYKSTIDSHHRYYARKALQEISVHYCVNPQFFMNEWTLLYDRLIERHAITGIAAFSKDSFTRQLAVPGITAFRAHEMGTTLGMCLWYVQDGIAYSHLSAYSDLGYTHRVSYPLYWVALDYFREAGCRWAMLGGGAGIRGNTTDGLTKFKKGWSTGTRTVYLCGRVLDLEAYRMLSARHAGSRLEFFPAYRAPVTV